VFIEKLSDVRLARRSLGGFCWHAAGQNTEIPSSWNCN